MGNGWSRADKYLYYYLTHDRFAVWLCWIFDNLLLGNKNGADIQWKKMLERCGQMEEGEMKRICWMKDCLQSSRELIEDDATSTYKIF